MNRDRLEGGWKQLTGSLRASWGGLTGNKTAEIDGHLAKLEGKLQAKYGKTKEDAKKLAGKGLSEA